MQKIDSIAAQVKHNCNISDAKHWGFYSPCGLLLRLRDLYRLENRIRPWERIKHAQVGKWIDAREGLWDEIEDGDYQQIEIGGVRYRPFDLKGINSALSNHGLYYGAGYGNLLKPVFILAELTATFKKGRYAVNILGREISRDLSTSPAMIQGNTIIMRHETMSVFFWNKFEEMKAKKCHGALHNAFYEYGIERDAEERMSHEDLVVRIAKLAEDELSTYVHHELGEASQRRVLGRWWKQLLLKLPYSRAELFLRGLKDIMADTCNAGMLSHIIKSRKAGSLYFYVSLLGGIRGGIFPDLIPAYTEFTGSGDWDLIEEARIEGYRKAGDYVRRLKDMFDRGRATKEAIEREFIS